MLSAGPLPFAALAIVLAVAIATAVGVALAGADRERRGRVFPALIDTLLVGLLTARLAFIARWWPLYAEDPWAVIRLGDGGYLVWPGIICAALWLAWRLHREPRLRRPLGGAVLAGGASWALATALLLLVRGVPPMLPEVELRRLDGSPVALAIERGQPLVLNLWASWCPPCRREMPALAAAQAQHRDVTFLFVNQGESAVEVRRYLMQEALRLDGVLLDEGSELSRQLGVRGLPTTLFFAGDGRLLASHVGELTRASLADRLERLPRAPGPPRAGATVSPAP